jgi:hypothetical protein
LPRTTTDSKPEAIKDWDKLSDNERKLFARQMEIFAGYSAIGENFHHLRQAFVEPALVNPKFGVTNRRYLLVVVGLG